MPETPTIPIAPATQIAGDPGLTQNDPRMILARIAEGIPRGQGTTSVGAQIPMPQIGTGPRPTGPATAAGEFATKGGHQRASMANLANTVTNVANTVHNLYEQHQNKQLGQKFSSFTGSIKGIQAADEMTQNAQALLRNDPNNVEAQNMLQQAQQMRQHNTTILNQMLDPSTPEGKKNIKLFNKGFGFSDANADSPERAAAISALQSQNKQLSTGAAGMLSRFPQGLQMSPATQAQAEMVKAGVAPKAATQGQILHEQGQAAKTITQDEQKSAQMKLNQARLGLDENNKPLPIESLPLPVRAKVEGERAGEALKAAQSQLAQARTNALANPNSPQNQLALMRARAMSSFAQSAAIRAQVSQLNYLMNARGVGPDGKPLPGSESIGGQTIGTRLAKQAQNVLQAQAAFTDVGGALDNLDAAAQALSQSGQKLNDPRLIKVMADPHFKSTDNQFFQNWFQSQIGESLSPEQRNYVIAQRQAKENITAIRRYTGGGVAQKQVDSMYATLPGATTPDYDTVKRQLNAVRGQMERLHTAIPQINVPNTPASAPQSGGDGLNLPPASKTGNNDPMGLFQ